MNLSGPYEESWASFGETIDNYFREHKEEYIQASYDVIIGFSRGGTILAGIISCILRDEFEEYKSKPHKASVRPIPRGLYVKREDPCFVMNLPASTSEVEDIDKYLENDLENFAKRNNNSEPISVLVVDDNLTGATRVKNLGKKLKENGWVRSYKLLAYNRHPDFTKSDIQTIRDFPENADYFIMPWHIDHKKKDLVVQSNDTDATKLKFNINVSSEFRLNDLYEALKIEGYNVRRRKSDAIIFSIQIGATQFNIIKKDADNFIELSYTSVMFYPPKQCLKKIGNGNNCHRAFDKKSICESDAGAVTKASCLLCSNLNCNVPLIKKILTFDENPKNIYVEEIAPNGIINEKLKPAAEEWFASLMPMNIVQNKNDI